MMILIIWYMTLTLALILFTDVLQINACCTIWIILGGTSLFYFYKITRYEYEEHRLNTLIHALIYKHGRVTPTDVPLEQRLDGDIGFCCRIISVTRKKHPTYFKKHRTILLHNFVLLKALRAKGACTYEHL